MLDKHRRRLRMFDNIANGDEEKESQHLLPAFAQTCLINATEKINQRLGNNIKIVTARYEADNEAVTQARERRCPVLSQDSDMMILICLKDMYLLTHSSGKLRIASNPYVANASRDRNCLMS